MSSTLHSDSNTHANIDLTSSSSSPPSLAKPISRKRKSIPSNERRANMFSYINSRKLVTIGNGVKGPGDSVPRHERPTPLSDTRVKQNIRDYSKRGERVRILKKVKHDDILARLSKIEFDSSKHGIISNDGKVKIMKEHYYPGLCYA